MNDQMLLDRMSQMIRLGFVNARQPEKMRVKVTLPDTTGSQLVTDWLPVLCPRACGDMQYDLPDIGDQVLCLFLAYGLEQGFVIGSMYGRQTPPVASGDKWHRKFSDGAYLEYDRASHTLTADIPGTVNIKGSQSITLEGPTIFIRGNLINTDSEGKPGKSIISGGLEVRNGGINVPTGDVQASGVSLTSHTTDGVQPGSGTSMQPTGGSAESIGTDPISIPDPDTLAYTAFTLSMLALMEEEANKTNNPTNTLIACLPKIALAEANKEKEKGNYDMEQAYHILAEMLEKWLSGSINYDPMKGGEPYWLSWNWLMQFPRFYNAYFDFTSRPPVPGKSNIWNEAAKISLGNYLCKNGYCQTGSTTPFDFIGRKENWREWAGDYHTSYPVPYEAELNPTMVVLGGFTLRALAKGRVEWLYRETFRICVEEMAIIVWDSINFEPETGLRAQIAQKILGLGHWRCEPPEMRVRPFENSTKLNNESFRTFQRETKYGSDFMVLTPPHIVENFKADCYDWSCSK